MDDPHEVLLFDFEEARMLAKIVTIISHDGASAVACLTLRKSAR
jgi:hypothetical protein